MDSLTPKQTKFVKPQADNQEMGTLLNGSNYQKYGRFVFAALGSIPWIGGLLGAAAALQAENEQGHINKLTHRWLEEHQQKIKLLEATLTNMARKFDLIGVGVEERLQDESYLSLVRHGFRVWDEASTDSKKEYIRRTLTNAATTKICSDDVIRIFLDWIKKFDEAHFRVVRVIFHNRGATRGFIWDEIGGADVQEDSSEADLFKLIIFDLSTGHVLRQIRDKNEAGQFLKKRRTGRVFRQQTLESAFEDTKPYELTALGGQFVTYVLNETVPRIL